MIEADEMIRRALQLQQEGQLEKAEVLLHCLLETDLKHAEALHLLGIIAYQENKIQIGIQFIERAIQSNPTVALFHSNLAEMHRQLNAIDLSIYHGQQAIALDPHSAGALSNLGIAYYDAKQYEKAEVYHKQALAINPKLSASLNNMGSIYKAYGKTAEAIAFYQSAIAISPPFIDSLNNLGALFLQQHAFKHALIYLNQAIALAPAFVDALCNMGLTLLGLEQWDKALMHFEKALQLNPDYPEAYYGMAKTYLYRQQFIEADKAIRNALRLKPAQIEFFQVLAEIYQAQREYKKALVYVDHALMLDPSRANLHLQKGSLLMEMGELMKAKEQFFKSAVHPHIDTQVLAHYSLVQLHSIKPNDLSLKTLLSLIKSKQAISLNKIDYAYFALGKCHDDMGEYSNAFEYFSLGCQVKRRRIHFAIGEELAFTDRLIQSFSQQTIDSLQSFANPSRLPLFIVGMPRSGTSLVEQILSSHSQVHGAGELNYLLQLMHQPIKHQQSIFHFPENLQYLSPHLAHSITTQYLSYLQRFFPQAKRITDKMPHNFMAIGLIHALFPNAKIIHVNRNPMDTCLSCYTKLFTQGQLYSYDLRELGQYYQCYERIMEHWRHLLPANSWLDIRYETMVTHFDEEAKRLIDFCELPWEPACLRFYQSKRQVRTASFAQVRQPVYSSSVDRWRQYEQELAPLIQVLNQKENGSMAANP